MVRLSLKDNVKRSDLGIKYISNHKNCQNVYLSNGSTICVTYNEVTHVANFQLFSQWSLENYYLSCSIMDAPDLLKILILGVERGEEEPFKIVTVKE